MTAMNSLLFKLT